MIVDNYQVRATVCGPLMRGAQIYEQPGNPATRQHAALQNRIAVSIGFAFM
jgi:hypothetical protein